jgi:hypothetical protein
MTTSMKKQGRAGRLRRRVANSALRPKTKVSVLEDFEPILEANKKALEILAKRQ